MVGRLAEGKGQDVLVEMAPDLPGTLVLVGDGPMRAELEGAARAGGTSDRVVFLGDRDDVPELLAVADVFVFASESEGLPLAVLEAMAAGLPVVAMTLPGLVPLVHDGENGYLVAQSDRAAFVARLGDVLADGGSSRLGRAARRHGRHGLRCRCDGAPGDRRLRRGAGVAWWYQEHLVAAEAQHEQFIVHHRPVCGARQSAWSPTTCNAERPAPPPRGVVGRAIDTDRGRRCKV